MTTHLRRGPFDLPLRCVYRMQYIADECYALISDTWYALRYQPLTGDPSTILCEVIKELDPGRRAVLVLRAVSKRSAADIAQQLGISRIRVRSRWWSVLRSLRWRLELHGVDLLSTDPPPRGPKVFRPLSWRKTEAVAITAAMQRLVA